MNATPHDGMFDDAPAPRTREELAAQLRELDDPYYQESGQREHRRGARASLLWVMGEAAESPISGTTLDGPPSMDDIANEAEYAHQAMSGSSERGRRWQEGRTAGYLQGCENTLFWAAKLGDDDF
ncbi:hypothetical protein AB0F17_35240 [Nonomuraea sp. NPDC026600]|uniref:hypothetical protein n=1 Tax=Nonomuraea sp. NPDC026600 TaxID=3155363 RepID=UPI0033FDC001